MPAEIITLPRNTAGAPRKSAESKARVASFAAAFAEQSRRQEQERQEEDQRTQAIRRLTEEAIHAMNKLFCVIGNRIDAGRTGDLVLNEANERAFRCK